MGRVAVVRVVALLLLAVAGPGCYQKPRDGACISRCQRDNDACLISATTAAAVQVCDERTTACVHYCN